MQAQDAHKDNNLAAPRFGTPPGRKEKDTHMDRAAQRKGLVHTLGMPQLGEEKGKEQAGRPEGSLEAPLERICSISCRIRRLPLDTSNLRVTHVSSSGIQTASVSGQAPTAVATSSVVHRCCFCCCCFCNRRAELLTTMKLTEKKKERGRRERRG